MSDLKVYMEPQYLNRTERADGGIRRVCEAMMKYLPDYGVEVVTSIEEAELTCGHGTMRPYASGKPFVSHNHGMLWTEYFKDSFNQNLNKEITDAFVHADAITAPSEWVKKAITRGILKEPEVIYHGVDAAEWENKERDYENYILWNKARADAVSDPTEMQRIAERVPLRFVSTLGEATSNVDIIGVHPAAQMKPFIQHAGLYLATTRETFGIGTLEALASGVPVVGWDYGGQSEIILNGFNGYLAPYGQYDELQDCIYRAFHHRRELSENAILDVRTQWQWADKIEQYANLYKRVATGYNAPRPTVTVVVPCYNLASYLPQALASVQQQTLESFECIVVDDCSTDDTFTVAREWVENDVRFRYVRTESNQGLSAVRNLGASKALGKYILYLDADDMLPNIALQLLSNALDSDAGIHIAYGSLELIDEKGENRKRNRFPQDYNWFGQMAHQNQVATAAMMRREVIETSGGWRTRQWRAEDAEFWARVTSFGFRAKKVTGETTLLYRIRSDSKGAIEFRNNADHDGNWLACIGWRSANDAQAGTEYLQRFNGTVPQPDLVPFGAQGLPREGFWNVSHNEHPLITVIVDAQGKDPTDVLDMLMGQNLNDWECYVIGNKLAGFPFARFVSDASEIKPRGTLRYDITADEQLSSDALSRFVKASSQRSEVATWLHEHKQLEPTSNGKVLLRYTDTNTARVPFRTRSGRMYLGQKDKTLWAEASDVPELLQLGKWAKVNTIKPIPDADRADIRV